MSSDHTPANTVGTGTHDDSGHAILRRILEGTATETGQRFFTALVKNLAAALDTHGAWVTEYIESIRVLRPLAFWLGHDFIQSPDEPIDGTPCEQVIQGADIVHYPDNLMEFFPERDQLKVLGVTSYMGVPLFDAGQNVMGHLAVLDTKPMPERRDLFAIFRIFAARAAAELQRIRAEAAVRERELKFNRALAGAMDAIIELDDRFRVTLVNAAGEKAFGAAAQDMVCKPFPSFLADAESAHLDAIREELNSLPEGKQQLWIKGGLRARGTAGAFAAEATLSRAESGGRAFYTLVLRNVNDRIEAERKIKTLTIETEYLRREIRELQHHDAILGRSPAVRALLEDIEQVAGSEATVLVLGETGTGKELIARAIHNASRRKDGPLIRVNCAAIPAQLIESEFFGHEKGAFTGATARRDGRFALAHEGTIFLDEIGELPLDVQAKLLRVLQDGEFEPVGSSRTRSVNVRVIAATNRNLDEASRKGAFREDLFYRLNVFPIHVPPLRDRGDDVVLLAESFATRFAQRMGKKLAPLTPKCAERLRAYAWPGNVRELQNIVERAVITAKDGQLDWSRCFPEHAGTVSAYNGPRADGNEGILTADDLRNLERNNMVRALLMANWKISGTDGAARALGMNASTLSSRMKALGIVRPA